MPSDNSGQPLVNVADSEIPDSKRDLVAEAYLAGSVDVVVRQSFDYVFAAFGVTASEEMLAALDELDPTAGAPISEMCADPAVIEGVQKRLRAWGLSE
ncbi:hypothetical protein [Nocardia sp. NPDC059228]|uniref:hypothetical protein n=1 Tax=Nocardia sp. NPDC059228 TaxID=3346777 RepID=UPI0036B13D14